MGNIYIIALFMRFSSILLSARRGRRRCNEGRSKVLPLLRVAAANDGIYVFTVNQRETHTEREREREREREKER
jgi:hypothetical protein